MASKTDKPTKADWDRLVEACIAKGWMVRYHNHPKTRSNW